MPIGMIFWTLMLIWFFFGLYWHGQSIQSAPGPFANHMLAFVLFFLLGWAQFGFVVQR